MSIFRTIALFVYLFGYMIVHYSVLCKAERALAAGDTETVAASTLSIDWRSEAILATTSATSGLFCAVRASMMVSDSVSSSGRSQSCSLSLMGISLPRTLPRHLPNSGHFAK